jgi:serine/threonine protein kinase
MWSAGIVFYCMLMGGLAWHKAKKTDAAYSAYTRSYDQHQVFDLFKALDENERHVLNRILDPNPKTRVTAAELLDDPWIKSIQVCDSISVKHNHTDGIQPVCKVSTKK